MSYYMGDYYRGDYYRGDPGFLSFFKRIGGAALGMIPGVGPIARTATTAIERIGATRAGGIVRQAGRVIAQHPVLSAAGAAGAIGALGGAAGERLALPGGVAPKGFHPCKSGRCKHAVVRNRHMRVTNPRALRRALRRVGGFSRLARRVMHFTHPRSKGRLAFRFPKRRKK